MAPPEVLAGPHGWAVAGWEQVVLHLSAGVEGLRVVLAVVDAQGALLSASDGVLYRTAGRIHHESVGGRFEPDGSFQGTRWSSVAAERGEDEEPEWESTSTAPTADDITALRLLAAELLRRPADAPA